MVSTPAPAALPPFDALLKSRDVEDPVNLWVHRPLAYAFVAMIYRTRITPHELVSRVLRRLRARPLSIFRYAGAGARALRARTR